jgi:hypothetical protein
MTDFGRSASPSGHSPSGLSQSSLSQAQPSVPNAARERAAFTAGWLAGTHRRDVPPEEAWLTYLDSCEGVRE